MIETSVRSSRNYRAEEARWRQCRAPSILKMLMEVGCYEDVAEFGEIVAMLKMLGAPAERQS